MYEEVFEVVVIKTVLEDREEFGDVSCRREEGGW